jgi:hypothetical protein
MTKPVNPSQLRAYDISLEPYIRSGRLWLSGSGRVAIGANNRLKMTISNPGGSGKMVRFHQWRLVATNAVWCELFINPTTNLPVTSRPIGSNIIDGRSHDGAVVVRSGIDGVEMEGGIKSSVAFGLGAAGRVENEDPIIVAPGYTFAFDTHSANNVDASFSLSWFELPI